MSDTETVALPSSLAIPPLPKRTHSQIWVDTSTHAVSRLLRGVVYYCYDCDFYSMNDIESMYVHQSRPSLRHLLSIGRWLSRPFGRSVMMEEPDWREAEENNLALWMRRRIEKYKESGV